MSSSDAGPGRPSVSSQQAQPTIVAVELFDSSTFKLPLTSISTPRSIIGLVAKKASMTQSDNFGLTSPRHAILGYSGAPETPIQGTVGRASVSIPDPEVDRLFLADNTPIMEQITLSKDSRLYLTVKYSFQDLRREIDDLKTLNLMYIECLQKLKSATSDTVSRENLVQLVGLSCYIKNDMSPAISASQYLLVKPKLAVEDARSFVPRAFLTSMSDDFFEESLRVSKSLGKISNRNALRKYLHLNKSLFPQNHSHKFDVMHVENTVPLHMTVSSEGIKIRSLDRSSPPLHLAHKNILCWSMVPLEEELSAAPRPSVSTPLVHTLTADTIPGSPGGARSTKSGISRKLLTKLNLDALSFGKDKKHRFILTITPVDETIQNIDLLLFANVPHDYRVNELLTFYQAQLKAGKTRHVCVAGEKLTLLDDKKDERLNLDDIILDDPAKSAEPIICIAKQDNVAKNDKELMFLEGEAIEIKAKISDEVYEGFCQGVQGLVYKSMVQFKQQPIPADESTKEFMDDVHYSVMLVDDSRTNVIVSSAATGKDLLDAVALRLDLKQPQFFGIYETVDGFPKQIQSSIPLYQQGILPTTKLVLRAKLLYHDVAELTESIMVSLYYMQVKEYVQSGLVTISEQEVIDFASLQVQASCGDNDSEKHKPNTMGSINFYLPTQFQKMSLTKNENWYFKRILAAHQQHKGLTKTEAEKAYIATAHRLNLFGYQLFSTAFPENTMLGISRDNFAILDRNTRSISDKFPMELGSVKFRNNSLSLEFTLLREDKTEKFFRVISAQAFEIIELLNFLEYEQQKTALRKKCRQIREVFNILGISLEVDPTRADLADIQDPELLFHALRNGVALSNLIPAFERVAPETMSAQTFTLETVLSAKGYSVFQSLDSATIYENIEAFITYCKETLTHPADKIFVPAELARSTFQQKSFAEVCESIQSVFASPKIQPKISFVQEYLKAMKMKAKPGNAQGGSSSSQPSMTREDFLKRVMDELLQTELNYTKDLQKIVAQFVTPLKERAQSLPDKSSSIEEEVLAIFGNVEELSNFHKRMIEELEPACKDPAQFALVGAIFETHAPTIVTLYEKYCANHSEPADRMPDLKNSPEVCVILGMNGDPQTDQMARHNLASQVIKPVQRIMRYQLLLKELIRYTPESVPEYKVLESGLQKMKDVATSVNEVKRRKENQRTLFNLQANIEGFDGNQLQSLGELIFEGNVVMNEKQFVISKQKFSSGTLKEPTHMFLFEDFLVLCKDSSKKKNGQVAYKYKGYVSMKEIQVRDKSPDIPATEDFKFFWELTRTDTQKTYLMNSSNAEEKDKWMTVFSDTISKALSKPASEKAEWLKKMSESSTISLDSVGKTKFANTVRKLGSWKRDSNNDGTEEPASPASSTQLPTSKTSDGDDMVERLSHQVDDLAANVKSLTEENAKLLEQVRAQAETVAQLEKEVAEGRQSKAAAAAAFKNPVLPPPLVTAKPKLASNYLAQSSSSPNLAQLLNSGSNHARQQTQPKGQPQVSETERTMQRDLTMQMKILMDIMEKTNASLKGGAEKS